MIFFLILIYNFNIYTGSLCDPNDKLFPCPKYIEKKVNFWFKIYTEVSNSQGVLHNVDSYEIYKTIDIKNLSNRSRRRHIRNQKQSLSNSLKISKRKIRFQKGQKDNFLAGLKRSYKYLSYIKDILKKHKLPIDLAYLPHVESSFNYKAYSKLGAAGIWQFTYWTGKEYMKISYTIDERRDPIKATIAAAKFIKKNHSRLKSWPITLTSYNHGLYGMLRAVRRHGRDYINILKNYRSRSFGFASKNFYSEFLAARHIAKNEELFFKDVIPHDAYKYKQITLKSYFDISTISDVTNLSIKTLSNYNPSLRNSVLRSKRYIPKGFKLRIPINNYSKILAKISSIPKSKKFARQKKPRWYRVRYGDNLSQISKRLGVSVSSLIAYNDLEDDYIHAGEVLEIPQSSTDLKKRITKNKKNTKKLISKNTNNKVDNKYGPPVPKSLSKKNIANLTTDNLLVYKFNNKSKPAFGYIRIQPEETLSHFSDWLITYRRNIKRWNRLRSNTVYINQRIKIFFTKISKEDFEQKRIEYHKTLYEDFFDNYKVTTTYNYKLKPGDSLWYLSNKKFNLPLWLLYMYNKDVNYRKLSFGQTLKIPSVEAI